MNEYVFQIGAKGFLIEELQKALGIFPDGRFGSDTASAVVAFARGSEPDARRRMEFEGATSFGNAGPAVFEALGLDWPEIFPRCLQLTMHFEGTGFAGVCGPRQTGDTWGVTAGAIGFTSRNGEVQRLLREALEMNATEFHAAAHRWFPDKQRMEFYSYIAEGANPQAFTDWALDASPNLLDRSVREQVKKFFWELGQLPWFRRLQMKRAHYDYWVPALKQVAALFGETVTNPRVFALLFDIAVQNGGLRKVELSDLVAQFRNGHYDERERMVEITTKLIARLRNDERPASAINATRSRKNTIWNGTGEVNKAPVKVGSFAL